MVVQAAAVAPAQVVRGLMAGRMSGGKAVLAEVAMAAGVLARLTPSVVAMAEVAMAVRLRTALRVELAGLLPA
jgi:hypothetical protein